MEPSGYCGRRRKGKLAAGGTIGGGAQAMIMQQLFTDTHDK
jgi:hypothetical protein